MLTVAYNIGYKTEGIGSGVLTYIPDIWEVENVREFSDSFRKKETIDILFQYAEHFTVTPSSITIFVKIIDPDFEWEFIIPMINVREYRLKWEEKYNKVWNGKTLKKK